MNEVNVILAEKEGFKFVTCVFAPYTGKQTYTYKTMLDVKEGDLLVVSTPSNGYQVVQAREILSPMEVDFEISYSYKWVVSIVDTSAYDEAVELEKAMLALINKSKNTRALAEAKTAILAGLDDNGRKALVRL